MKDERREALINSLCVLYARYIAADPQTAKEIIREGQRCVKIIHLLYGPEEGKEIVSEARKRVEMTNVPI